MAKYELPIYGENEEVIKTGEANIVKWAVVEKALDLSETVNDMRPREQLEAMTEIVLMAFPNLSREDISNADRDDIRNTFYQIVGVGNGINKGSKNA